MASLQDWRWVTGTVKVRVKRSEGVLGVVVGVVIIGGWP